MCPGSGERCDATSLAGSAGASRAAASADVLLMNPSITTGTLVRGGAEREPGEHAELEAADRGEHADRVGGIGVVEPQPASTTATLCASPASSRPVPRPHVSCGPALEQRRGDRGRRGRVADAHLAERDQAVVAHQLVRKLDARRERGLRLARASSPARP